MSTIFAGRLASRKNLTRAEYLPHLKAYHVWAMIRMCQQAHGVLASVASSSHKLIKDARLLCGTFLSVPRSNLNRGAT